MSGENEMVPGGWAPSTYAHNVWGKYNVSIDVVKRLFVEQGGCCGGCKKALAHPLVKSATLALKPYVDHDHTKPKGEVRGLLCRRCNTLLGKIQDSKELLLNLEAYLRKAGSW